MTTPLAGRRVLLVVGGGIAAYKTPDLVRHLRALGLHVRCVLTDAGARFVAPLALAAVSGEKVWQDLFSLTDEAEMGHIRLARDCDAVAVIPATANRLARLAHGLADDLAATLLLATDRPVLVAPAMNTVMWTAAATQANVALLRQRRVRVVPPATGDLACGAHGPGRLPDLPTLTAEITALLGAGPLAGRHVLVTAGPTQEPLDPVRVLTNHSSGRQGYAVAEALARRGARVTLVSGPTALPCPSGVTRVAVTTGRDMLAACDSALPADAAVCVAAVSDWRPATEAPQKMKKKGPHDAPTLTLVANPDILATLAAPGPRRPRLVVGFAAETENVVTQAVAKRERKGCDWLVANDVTAHPFGGATNAVHLITATGVDAWPPQDKQAVAEALAERITAALGDDRQQEG